jgi:hypothetical protein
MVEKYSGLFLDLGKYKLFLSLGKQIKGRREDNSNDNSDRYQKFSTKSIFNLKIQDHKPKGLLSTIRTDS